MWPFKAKAGKPARIMPAISYVDGERWAAGGVGGSMSSITPQQAEALAACLGAVNAIAATIGSLPSYVVKADATRAEVPGHPLQELIDFGPNDRETWSDFIEGMLASCLLRGNFLASIETNDRGRLTALKTLPWANVTPWANDAGDLLFDFLPTLPPNAGKRQRYSRQDTFFMKDRSDDGVIGRSRISRAALSLQSALTVETNVRQFLGNAARPSGSLTAPGKVSEPTAKRLADDWDNNYNGDGKGKTAILPEGIKYEVLSLMSSEDAQWVLHKNFSVAEVARLFGVPPFMLADPSRSTFASAKEATRHFAMTSLAPWTRRIERAMRQTVLAPGYALQIDLDSLIKADIGELYSALLKGRQGGWLSPNDARSETGFPLVADGDSIAPPVMGGAQPPDLADDEPKPAPGTPADDEGKIAPLFQRRSLQHASD